MRFAQYSLILSLFVLLLPNTAQAEFRVGTSVTDITPEQLPVLVNGGMRTRSADEVRARLNARALVLDDGKERLAIVVVDTCMMPRPLLDEVKQRAAQRTEIRADRMLISATHTHSAPASMGCLGTDADSSYVPFLSEKLATAIANAEKSLQPARVGWAVANAEEYTALRRWIRRPDRIADDPFGNPTVRANMHAGRNWDDVTGESGPEDPDLSLISFQTPAGQPIAVLANFSMHYFGDQPLSADYFGLFCEGLKAHIAPDTADTPSSFVGILSHNCSGDIWRRDYTNPESGNDGHTIKTFAEGLLAIALKAYETIEYKSDVDLAMAEARMKFAYRVPDKQRLEWAERIVETMGDRPPKDTTEVYAREQVLLHEQQSTEIVVQALRIGDIAIATTPNETYALTGLKLKKQSPLPQTMVIELANGGDGYIPPPEQHLLGGYNTWPARSAGLEVEAEPRIVETILQLLEQVAGKPRRLFKQSLGAGAEAILEAKPAAYWRLDEFEGPRALDSSGHDCDAVYEPAIAYFLEGPQSGFFCTDGETNRCVHFVGDRLRARLPKLGDSYSVSLWFWNGMPVDARPVSGWIFSRGRDFGLDPCCDHLGLGGADNHSGRLVFQHGTSPLLAGRTQVPRWTWNHVLFVREGDRVSIYLNGASEAEIETKCPVAFPPGFDRIFFGGRCDDESNWEGRLDEIAVFNRAVSVQDFATPPTSRLAQKAAR